MDEVELPMLMCLLEQIGETPPHDFLANAQVKAQQEKIEREKKGALTEFKIEKGKVRRRNTDGD